jgi:hypothetical protein
MAWVRLLTSMLVLIFAFGATPARTTYVGEIERERGSLDSVRIDITSAREGHIFAQGYERWGIEGKQIYIEAVAENRTDDVLLFVVVFSARDVFGKVLDTCEKRMRLEPEVGQPFKCMLQVNDARNFFEVTYKVAPIDTRQNNP